MPVAGTVAFTCITPGTEPVGAAEPCTAADCPSMVTVISPLGVTVPEMRLASSPKLDWVVSPAPLTKIEITEPFAAVADEPLTV